MNLPDRFVQRPRRLRRNPAIRDLVRENQVQPARLVQPLFVVDGTNRSEPIDAMPGQYRLSIDQLVRHAEMAADLGLRAIALFPAMESSCKSADASVGLDPENVLCRAVRALRQALPDLCIITDVALDPYSSHGHDGLVGPAGQILNDETNALLARMAVLHGSCGADFVAPSDMMDGRVAVIRAALDAQGLTDTGILSYAAKYASSLYGPFREALDSAPVIGPNIPRDKKTYQMDPANVREAVREVRLDEAEGADIVMIKPALHYLDVIARIRAETTLPVAAYHVSGEYAMVKAAAARGWVDERAAMTEALLAITRAGADLTFTYAAMDFARWSHEE